METYGAAWHQGRKENENVKEGTYLEGEIREKRREVDISGVVFLESHERENVD